MDLSFIKLNFATLAIGCDEGEVARFMREKLWTKAGRPVGKYFVEALEARTLTGNHQWSNLATILHGHGNLHGLTCSREVAFCYLRASDSEPPAFLPMQSILLRQQAQLSD